MVLKVDETSSASEEAVPLRILGASCILHQIWNLTYLCDVLVWIAQNTTVTSKYSNAYFHIHDDRIKLIARSNVPVANFCPKRRHSKLYRTW